MSSSNVNHLSETCIYERKSSFMKWIGKLFKCVETSSGRAVAAGGGGGDQSQLSSRRAPVDFGGVFNFMLVVTLLLIMRERYRPRVLLQRAQSSQIFHPFWSQKYCPSHEHDNTPRCYSCERLEGFHHMPDTRGLCLSEKKTFSSIMKRPQMECRGLVGLRTQPQKLTRTHEVAAILVLYGLPWLLTGAILAHDLMHGWLRLNGYHNLRPEVEEGLCQVLAHMWLESEVIIPTASRSMPSTSAASLSSSRWSYGSTNMPFNSAASSSSSRWSHGSTNMPSNSGALSSPTWSNGSTSIPSSSPTSSSWSSSKKGSKSSDENKLGKFFMHQIAHGASPAYGEGYRAAMKAVNKYGLRATLDNIRFTGTFPY